MPLPKNVCRAIYDPLLLEDVAIMISRLKKIPVWLWVIAAFFLLNVFTYNWYPSVWLDEVAFVDPAANLYYGHGFTSSLRV